jgi:hypothetical protein
MCRCNDTELNCVSTYIRSIWELMAFEIEMSIRRYLAATGTAGLLRRSVSGSSRVPRPPPRMTTVTVRASSSNVLMGTRSF